MPAGGIHNAIGALDNGGANISIFEEGLKPVAGVAPTPTTEGDGLFGSVSDAVAL